VLVFWTEVFGVQPGDRWSIEIRDSGRQTFAHGEGEIPRHMAVFRAMTGKKRGAAPLPVGCYSAEFRLIRGGEAVMREEREIAVQR